MINLPLSIYRALCDEITDVYIDISKDELGKVDSKIGFPVDGIYESSDGKGVILEYRDCNRINCYHEKFDYVICTIPFSSLRRVKTNPLFSQRKIQAIIELHYEVAQKTFLFLKDRFWECAPPCTRIVGGNTLTDLPNTSVFYPSDHAVQIPNIESGYLDGRLIDFITINWAQVQYLWAGASIMKPEDKTLFSYAVTLPEMNNKVFFAGEHISQKHVWQQGSFQTGMIAANQVAERIKAKRS